jgi:hypothetical protein
MRVVASYTTLPSRYDVLKTSIASLKAQTHKLDAIYVAIPHRATRLNKEYPPIPDDLAAMCTVVRVDTDYGPITKMYGALLMESDPETVIMSCDDDVFFPPEMVEKLLSHQITHPNSAICGTGALLGRGLFFFSIVSTVYPFHTWRGFTGFPVGPEGKAIDLIFGVAGVMYKRKFFPKKDKLHEKILQYSLADSTIFHNDDVLISGYLSKKGIERRLFYDIPVIKHLNGDDALSGDVLKMIKRMNESIAHVKELGFFPTMEENNWDETPAGRVLIAIILIIVIVAGAIAYYKMIE